MQPIIQKISKELKSIELHVVSDLHIGDKLCNTKAIIDRFNHIKKTPNAFVILAGDLVNNATTSSVSDTYEEQLSPMEQMRTVIAMLEPIKDKILAVTSGNHEERTYKTDGIDLTALICNELRLGDIYRPDAAVLFLKVGTLSKKKTEERQASYVVYINHGSRGGRKIGGKANALQETAAIIDADLYIVGHTHSPMVFKDRFIRTSEAQCSARFVDRTFVNTAASLNYGGYAARGGYVPASQANPVVIISGTEKKIDVRM